MRLGAWLQSNFFSKHGVTDVMFPSTATFQELQTVRDSFGELRTDVAGSWLNVEPYTAIPCLLGAEVTGRPASSTEYQNSGPTPNSKSEADYLYLMLKGYYPGLRKRWRVVVDGMPFTASPNADNSDGDVWGIEHDSQKTFTRLRVYKQRY